MLCRFLLSLSLLCAPALAMEGGAPNQDPYAHTNYRLAFSPEIFKKFIDVLEQDGTWVNMPDGAMELPTHAPEHRIQIEDLSESYGRRSEELRAAILKQVRVAKRDAVLRPLYEAGLIMAAQGACMIPLLYLMPSDSYGGGFGVFAFFNVLGWVSKDAGKAIYTYRNPGNDPMGYWEELFAERMRFIPNRLWDPIVNMFGAARMGRYSHRDAIAFFEVAFHLPTLHRYPYVPPLGPQEIDEKAQGLEGFIEGFFQDYENGDEAALKIKAATRQFLIKLAENQPGFIAMHLLGKGGIGKTHFVKALVSEMNRQGLGLPVEEVTIRGENAEALEGSPETPGQLLSALVRMGKTGKPYGILIFDEAEWLNSDGLKASAKKTFEPDLGFFVSDYLKGLDVSCQGYMLWFMSNEEVKDPHLRSRLNPISFPSLKKTALERMAKELLPGFLPHSGLDQSDVKNNGHLTKLLEDPETTMRTVKRELPVILTRIRGEKSKKD